jgi:cell division protein FtsB
MKDNIKEVDLTKRIDELENSLSIALEINDKYQRENKELKRDNSILAADVATLNNRLNQMDPIPALRRKGL